MNDLPYAFFDDLFSRITVLRTLTKQEMLSGRFGQCASCWEENYHDKQLEILDGRLIDVLCFRNSTKTSVFSAKFRARNRVVYYASNGEVPKIDPELHRSLDKHRKERQGILYLCLVSSTLDAEWIQMFSAWKNLNSLEVFCAFTGPVVQLLENLLNQEQLVALIIRNKSYGPTEIDLFVKFLEQKQFLELRFCNRTGDNVKDRIFAEEDLGKFAGSVICWQRCVELHDDLFEALGRVEEVSIQFKKQNLVVSYYNCDATAEMTESQFMDGVTRCELRFLHDH
ncbi:hypothetical protein L596_001317 [Steinernema carpocapsae]|uniref:F-box associated domain-containing protein n=1 Tax=Steinernema carpocapsae TaxID=34508 RepID=A0A4U8UKX0_STECR|nr:hypothetical protein L596_001317 [Steinernema carpocapsae]